LAALQNACATPEQRKLKALQKKKMERDAHVKKDTEKTGDPYHSLGFGLIAYRTTFFTLGIALLLLSVLTLPIINIYQSGTNHPAHDDETARYDKTVAFLGYSKVRCSTSQFAMQSL
jgi:hypothetical protein